VPTATAAPIGDRASRKREGLLCRVRLAEGRAFAGPLARAIGRSSSRANIGRDVRL
jgi:hypothetical protein